MNALLQYTLIRLALFAGVLAVLLAVGLDWLLSAIIAAIIGLCVSYIFLRPQQEAVAGAVAARIERSRNTRDADHAEDEALDRSE